MTRVILWIAGIGLFGLTTILSLRSKRIQRYVRQLIRNFPKLQWIGVAVVIWLIIFAVLGVWLGGSVLKWWDVTTWLTPINQLQPIKVGFKSPHEIQIEQLRNLLGAIALMLGSFVGAIQIGNSLHRTQLAQREKDASRERLNAEVFAKAVEQLGNDKHATRLGAIYSLEALALSDQTRGCTHLTNQIMETMASFVRERSQDVLNAIEENGKEPKLTTRIMEAIVSHMPSQAATAPIGDKPADFDHERTPSDIAAAFMVLVRSYPHELRPGLDVGGIDLRNAYLVGVRLYQKSDLRSFNLSGSKLMGASLYGCDLRGTWLSGADLTKVRFTNARIDNTYFSNPTWGDAQGLDGTVTTEVQKWAPSKEPKWPAYHHAPTANEGGSSP